MTIKFRRALSALAALTLLLAGTVAATVPASAAAAGLPTVTNIRTGANPGFDRIVLDINGAVPVDFNYRFVDELIADPSGEIVWLTGQSFIEVNVNGLTAHDESGNRTYPGPDKFRTRNLSNVMAVAFTGDWEGQLNLGLGVRTNTWVRITTLTAPSRLVIDVGQ